MTTSHPQEQEVRELLKKLTDAGAKLSFFDDGGECVDPTVENITSVDQGVLNIWTPEGREVGLFLVFGNDPGELVADYTCCEFLDEVLS